MRRTFAGHQHKLVGCIVGITLTDGSFALSHSK
jgi:hypothetical protein